MSKSKIKAFLHPVMLRTERSFKRLMKDFGGGVGYGVAMMLIEILSSEDKQEIHIQDIDLLADEIGVSIPIIKTIISKYNIFIVEDNYIKCPLLDEWLQPFKKRIEQNRKAGQISAEKRKEKAKHQELQLLQNLSVVNSSQQVLNTCSTNKIKENKRKEKKELLQEKKVAKSEKSGGSKNEFSQAEINKWLKIKSKGKNNPSAYAAALKSKIIKRDESVIDELRQWIQMSKKTKAEEYYFQVISEAQKYIGIALQTAAGEKIISSIEPKENDQIKVNYQDGNFSIIPNLDTFKQTMQRIQYAE